MVSEDFTVNDLKAAKKLLTEQNKTISEYTAKIKNHQSLQTKIEQQQTLLEQKTTALETVVVAQDQLKNSDDINPQESRTLELTLTDSEHEEQELTTKVTEQLVALGEKLPAKGKEDKVLQRLQQRQQAFQDQLDQQVALQQEIISLTEKLKTSQTKSQQLNQQREQCTTSLHVSEVASLHLAMVEKQKLIADKEQGLEQQQQSIKAFDQQFKATLEATGVSDIEAAQKLLESKQKMPEMQQQLTHLIG
jgi:exonuclease SbcC